MNHNQLTVALVSLCLCAAPVHAQTSAKNTVKANQTNSTPILRAQLKAKDFTTLSANLAGKIMTLSAPEGTRVSKGQSIAVMDCSYQEAEKSIAEAKLDAADANFKANKRLEQLDSVGSLEVHLSEAEKSMAEAQLKAIDVTLSKCKIDAPFDGIITKQFVQAHQFIREGEPLVELTSSNNLEIETIVPSTWLRWLRKDTEFSITVYETKETLKAKVDRIGGRVDPLSQTVRVIGVFTKQPKHLLSGMSGTLDFPKRHK